MSERCEYIRTSGTTHWCALAAAPVDQKPVAWMYTSHWKGNERYITRYQTDLTTYKADKVWPLYTAPRQWIGLTDEERRNIREWQEIQGELGPVWAPMMLYLYLAIEAKLKEKNT